MVFLFFWFYWFFWFSRCFFVFLVFSNFFGFLYFSRFVHFAARIVFTLVLRLWWSACIPKVDQKSNTSAYQNLSPIHLLYFHYLLLHDCFSFCFVACIWFGRSTFLCKRMDIDCIALCDCCVVLLGQEQHDEVMAVWFHLIDAGGIVFEPAECLFTNWGVDAFQPAI